MRTIKRKINLTLGFRILERFGKEKMKMIEM